MGEYDKMNDYLSRSQPLLTREGLERLASARVAVFGIGGVGGYCAEILARSGIGHLLLIDNDVVERSNINRQIVALNSTVGRYKTDVMKERIHDINPDCQVVALHLFYTGKDSPVDIGSLDYVVDCIDTVTSKVELSAACRAAGVESISVMGTGNRLDAYGFEATDIYRTTGCPLAKAVRSAMRRRGDIPYQRVIYSPAAAERIDCHDSDSRHTPASVAYVPAVAGALAASEAIRYLTGRGV